MEEERAIPTTAVFACSCEGLAFRPFRRYRGTRWRGCLSNPRWRRGGTATAYSAA